jgi:hypothetical protein
MFERTLLYVGPPKTGTTSIQLFVWKNRDSLMAQGFYVPKTGRRGIQHLGLAAMMAQDALGFRKKFLTRRANMDRERFLADLNQELRGAPVAHTLLFMSENLFGADLPEVRAYREVLVGFAPRLESLMYLRRQDRWMASRIFQKRKSGSRDSLEMRVGSSEQYENHVRRWYSESDKCIIRRFDSEFLLNGSLIQDFCDAIGANTSQLDVTEVWSNTALLQEQIELVDAFNMHIESLRRRRRIYLRTNLLSLCSELLGGAKVEFPRGAAMEIFESCRGINAWLHETVDPAGPPLFFNTDFDRYKVDPTNDKRYTIDQLKRLFAAISPGATPETERSALIEQTLVSFLADPEANTPSISRSD